MTKTRKNRRSRSHTSNSKTQLKTSSPLQEYNSVFHHTKCCEATFDGIQKWYVNKFEKLGWMVLAKKHGHEERVREYKHSLKKLKEAIEHKLTHVTENDRKHDLMVMHHNVDILIEHANKDL